MSKIILEWRHFDKYADEIARAYSLEKLELIIGLSRGGLPLAVSLSHKLGIPMEPLEWQTRDGIQRRDVSKARDLRFKDPLKVLFVDDICDSGKTINEIRMMLPQSRWATLFSKHGNKLVEFCPTPITNDLPWIEFPWEKKFKR